MFLVSPVLLNSCDEILNYDCLSMSEKTEKSVLKNGVRIISRRMPHLRSVSLGIWVDAGARDERAEEAGFSHFIEHMMFKGTQTRSAFDIAKAFDAIGGATNAFTAMENTCYHARAMDSNLPQMAEILVDMLVNPLFDAQDMERERSVIFSEMGMLEDSPDDWVHHLTAETFWGSHPLGRSILGRPDTLTRVDADGLKTFFRKLYQPERIVITAAGGVDHADLLKLLEPAFAAIEPGAPLPEREAPQAQFATRAVERDLEQVHLCLSLPGLSVTAKERFAFSLLTTILGGNMSSRLFQEIREKRGLAYSVYAFANAFVDSGMFGVYAAVTKDHLKETLAEIKKQLRRLSQEKIPEAELSSAKAYVEGNLLMAAESNDHQMTRLAQNEIYFGKNHGLKKALSRIHAVTSDELMTLSRKLFSDKQYALTTVGPVTQTSLDRLI